MERIKLILAVLFGGVLGTYAVAQVSVVSASIDSYQFAPSTFLSATLSNASAPVRVRLQGDVRSASGVQVLRFRSTPIQVPTGIFRVVRQSYGMELFVRTNAPGPFIMGLDQRLASGEYTLCVTAESMAEDEPMMPFCGEQLVEDLLFMDLVSPANGDSIDEVRPGLSWVLTGSALPADHSARLSLVSIGQGVDAYQAHAVSRPVFLLSDVRPGLVGFPASAPDLERGRCYSWQVERISNGLVVDRTEAWRFCIREQRSPKPEKYVLMGRVATAATVDAVDGFLYLRIDDGMGAPPKLRILQATGGENVPATSDQRMPDPSVRSTAPGLYEVDLQPCGLGRGEYVIVRDNGPGRPLDRLRFRITE